MSEVENVILEREKNNIARATLDLDLVEQLFLHFESTARGEKDKQYKQIAAASGNLGKRYVEILIRIWRHYVIVVCVGDRSFLEEIWHQGVTKLKMIIPIVRTRGDYEKYRSIVNALSTRDLEKEVNRIRNAEGKGGKQ